MAAEMSCRLGWIDDNKVNKINALLNRASLPASPPESMSGADFMGLMSVDKKVLDGKMRLVRLGRKFIEVGALAEISSRS